MCLQVDREAGEAGVLVTFNKNDSLGLVLQRQRLPIYKARREKIYICASTRNAKEPSLCAPSLRPRQRLRAHGLGVGLWCWRQRARSFASKRMGRLLLILRLAPCVKLLAVQRTRCARADLPRPTAEPLGRPRLPPCSPLQIRDNILFLIETRATVVVVGAPQP